MAMFGTPAFAQAPAAILKVELRNVVSIKWTPQIFRSGEPIRLAASCYLNNVEPLLGKELPLTYAKVQPVLSQIWFYYFRGLAALGGT